MEVVFQYFLKVNGLLVVFYFAYQFFLRKETFFQSNRWFLLLGIASSFIFPLISFTNVIWIEPEPLLQSTSNYYPITNFQVKPIDETFNWHNFLFTCYTIVSFFFFARLTIEIFSFFKIIKKGTKIKSDNIVLVETNGNQNPFSFFNYLVFNQSNFTKEELKMILIHEKIHIQQKHSTDVLLGKLLCLLFWINPIVWLYQKAILENLEFIADSETAKFTNNKYVYQKTLLKSIITTNQLSITNQFYQSLIKKRIVMLNTNPSHRKKLWKYSIVVPFLVAFVFLFQIETIAQVKENTIEENDYAFSSEYSSVITSKSSDEDLKELEKTFSDEKTILKITKVKRNKANEIIAIKLSFYTGKSYNTVLEKKSNEPINDIEIYVSSDESNAKIVGFNELDFKNLESLTTEEFEDENSEKNEYWSMDNMSKNGKEVVLIINGKVQGATEKVKLPLNEEFGEMKEIPADKLEKKYKIKVDKNKYYYEVETVKINSHHELPEPPVPPTPPSHPYEKLKKAPTPPNFPEAPQTPSNFDDEGEMKKFDEKMAAFEKKMKKLEPQIEKFEKEMEDFEMEMEGLEPETKNFEKKMEKFEQEMEIYQEKLIKAQKKATKSQIEAENKKIKANMGKQKAKE